MDYELDTGDDLSDQWNQMNDQSRNIIPWAGLKHKKYIHWKLRYKFPLCTFAVEQFLTIMLLTAVALYTMLRQICLSNIIHCLLHVTIGIMSHHWTYRHFQVQLPILTGYSKPSKTVISGNILLAYPAKYAVQCKYIILMLFTRSKRQNSIQSMMSIYLKQVINNIAWISPVVL